MIFWQYFQEKTQSTKLRKLHEEDGAIIISPNGHFVRTSEIKINSNSSLERYNTVIANSLILKGVYYYEIKILELGNNSDICFGIIGKDCDFMNNKRYKNFPLCEFEDCYGFNCFNDRAINPSNHLKVGTVISIKVDLNKNKIFIYFNGENLTVKVNTSTISVNGIDIIDRLVVTTFI